jgi:nitroimidazol reductase NimA-like FMN-containing flavoprotein (pyridoxamine 5'-phosphate oxidase superfamily)
MRSRAINDQKEIYDVIRRSQWCHVAMTDPDGKPYVIPMNFGFSDDVIYIHGAQHGKKTTSLMCHPEVCINFATDQELRYQSEQVACSWSMKYRSVLCYGVAEFITDPAKKVAALNIIMAQYTNREFNYNPPSIREVNVIKIKVSRYEGRAYGY